MTNSESVINNPNRTNVAPSRIASLLLTFSLATPLCRKNHADPNKAT